MSREGFPDAPWFDQFNWEYDKPFGVEGLGSRVEGLGLRVKG